MNKTVEKLVYIVKLNIFLDTAPLGLIHKIIQITKYIPYMKFD